jgi:hypothetical protein
MKRCGFYTRNGTMDVPHCVAPSSTVRCPVSKRLLWNHIASATSRHFVVWVCFGRAVSKLLSSLLSFWYNLPLSANCTVPSLAHKILHALHCSNPPQLTTAQAHVYRTYSRSGYHCCLEICRHGFNRRSGYRISTFCSVTQWNMSP